jgi:1-acyl-sn-glycerol-3-phosphate acyltransferase
VAALAFCMNVPGSSVDPRRRNSVWWSIQAILRPIFLFWLRYRARGLEHLPQGGALLLINHQSFIDPLMVGLPLKRPVSYLARDSLFRVPVIGWILRNTYVMPIRREAAGTESIRKSVERLEQGYYVGIFPEGTRSPDGKLGEVKPGFIALVRRTHVPVIPVGIAGAGEALPRRSWWLRPARVHVVFGEPIPVELIEELSQRGREQELVEMIRERMQNCLEEAERWRQPGRATP